MPSPQGRILYCEDDLESLELIRFLFTHLGYEIICTENSLDALRLAKSEQFDLFLLDNWMPQMSGEELTLRIREFNQTTPILFYSAAVYEADKQAAFDAGAQGYLTKPPDVDELIHEVRRLIASKA